MPDEGARRLRDMDLDAQFTYALTRRAAAFVRDHAAAPSAALPGDDAELRGLIAELVLRADDLEPSAATLEVESLQLELGRLDRAIAAARVEGAEVRELAAERQRIRDEIHRKLH